MRTVWVSLWMTAGLAAQDPAAIDAALSRLLLDPKQPAVEVQIYTASRVPVLPVFRDPAEWRQYAARVRQDVEGVIFRGEARRWRDAPVRVEWLDSLPGAGYRVRKLRFEALPGLWVPALLYEPEKLSGRVPVVLNVNGHEKTGVSTPYIQMRCINLAKKGLLALNIEWLGRGQLDLPNFQHARMNQLDLAGTSGVAVFYLSLRRSLDIAAGLEHADPKRIAVTGLSGGGWQTIILSALDERVALSNPVAGYSSYVTRSQFPELDLGDSEQTPSDLAAAADYTHLTALLAPRPALLTYNAKDNCCFRADYAPGPLLQAARPVYALLGAADRLRYHANHDPGHNYARDNREAFYRMIRDYFFAGESKFSTKDIPADGEVRTAEQLHVPLPDGNADFNSLALALSRGLPRQADLSKEQGSQEQGRTQLASIVRAKTYVVDAEAVEPAESGDTAGIRSRHWRLRMDGAWTVPAAELEPKQAGSTMLLISDRGRASLSADAGRLLAEGRRVVALDPFYFGESRIDRRDYLFAILVAGIGDRPLGIQASQVAAAARWLRQRDSVPVTVSATGPRSSLIALVAAALEPRAIAGIELRESMGSLKEVIEQNLSVDKVPELFCFGLLEAFDIKQLVALVAPRPVQLRLGKGTERTQVD